MQRSPNQESSLTNTTVLKLEESYVLKVLEHLRKIVQSHYNGKPLSKRDYQILQIKDHSLPPQGMIRAMVGSSPLYRTVFAEDVSNARSHHISETDWLNSLYDIYHAQTGVVNQTSVTAYLEDHPEYPSLRTFCNHFGKTYRELWSFAASLNRIPVTRRVGKRIESPFPMQRIRFTNEDLQVVLWTLKRYLATTGRDSISPTQYQRVSKMNTWMPSLNTLKRIKSDALYRSVIQRQPKRMKNVTETSQDRDAVPSSNYAAAQRQQIEYCLDQAMADPRSFIASSGPFKGMSYIDLLTSAYDRLDHSSLQTWTKALRDTSGLPSIGTFQRHFELSQRLVMVLGKRLSQVVPTKTLIPLTDNAIRILQVYRDNPGSFIFHSTRYPHTSLMALLIEAYQTTHHTSAGYWAKELNRRPDLPSLDTFKSKFNATGKDLLAIAQALTLQNTIGFRPTRRS